MNTQKLKELAQDAAKHFGDDWDSALVGDDSGNYHAITSEANNLEVVRTDSDSRTNSWLCDYLEAVSPKHTLGLLARLEAAERDRDELRVELKASSANAMTWMKRALSAEKELERRDAVMNERIGEWAIDMSCGRPILVCKGCSVIEENDAEYVLSLIERDAAAGEPVGFIDQRVIDSEDGNGGMWVKRQSRQENSYSVPIYTAAPPAVLPQLPDDIDISIQTGTDRYSATENAAFIYGAQWMRRQFIEQAEELGAQPQRVVELAKGLSVSEKAHQSHVASTGKCTEIGGEKLPG